MMANERRSLTAYVAAYVVSMLGDRFAELALPLVVLAATGDPAAAGAVAATMQVPYFVLSLWLGRQVDLRSRRALMIGADLLRAMCFGGFALFAAGHLRVLWPYLVIGFVAGCGNVTFGLAGATIVPELVGGPRLVRANALVEAGDAVTTVTGPPLAGLVVVRLSAAAALVANAVSFVVSAALLVALGPARRTAAVPRSQGPAATSLRAREVLRDPTQGGVLVALIGLSAHGAGVVLAIIYFSQTDLHLSTGQIGLILGAAGIGGLVASAAAVRWTQPFSTVRGIAATLWISGALMLVLASAGGFWWALLANAFVDAAVTAGFIAAATVRQQWTPIEVLGRTTAVSVLCNAIARIVGAAGIGVVLKLAGGRVGLLADATILGAAALFVTVRGAARRAPLHTASPTPDTVTIEGGTP